MQNDSRPRFGKWYRKLRAWMVFSPASSIQNASQIGRGSLESPKQREVQLELELFDRRTQPWFFTD